MKNEQDDQGEKMREAAIDCAKQLVGDFIDGMAGISPEDAERRARQIRTLCEVDDLLPAGFKQKALGQARDMECDANMRHCDQLLRQALSLSVAGRMQERAMTLAEARRYYGRACRLGAAQAWRRAFQRAEENLLLTGGRRSGEPTAAKPLDSAPPTPNRAKA